MSVDNAVYGICLLLKRYETGGGNWDLDSDHVLRDTVELGLFLVACGVPARRNHIVMAAAAAAAARGSSRRSRSSKSRTTTTTMVLLLLLVV